MKKTISITLSLLFWFAASFAMQQAASDEPLLSLGIIADAQYCDCETANNRHYRESLAKLDEAVAEFEKRQVDMVVSLGDLIDRDYGSFQPALARLAPLSMPVYHVLGNHDFSVAPDRLEEVPSMQGMESRYYANSIGNLRLIYLDGNDVSLFANAPGSTPYIRAEALIDSLKVAGAPNGKPWNGGLGDEQYRWLVSELESAATANERVILFCHYPLFPESEAHNLWGDERLRELILGYPNVMAYFNGHRHTGDYHLAQGVHFLNFKGMVENSPNAFAIVDVYADRLVVTGYGREASRSLSVSNDVTGK
ncbi:metallophosphoesterase [Parapedobacter sp. 10938]|uniref:metallophosphoesterase n=1 Tax=Parapedobacter flavus TaxID=3110225 RepID=UPI002DBF7B12|nr:metallophosphoesterase [Parapedobacter sp. 10938]MEC3879447.1 metallophosphoesterase [Parapedobacter sp. 10938]